MRLLKMDDVCSLLQITRSAVEGRLRRGTFPKPIRLGNRSLRWREDVITQWIKAGCPERFEESAAASN